MIIFRFEFGDAVGQVQGNNSDQDRSSDQRHPKYHGPGSFKTDTALAYPGGSGGGAIRVISATRILLDGSMTADGGNGQHDAGSGSGGGIYLRTPRMHGHGTLSVVGGNTGGTSGGGGGGRIAVWSTVLTFPTGNATAAGGVHSTTPSKNGEDGTIVWGVIPPTGTIFTVR